jgi:hypothetical protein
MYRSKLFLRLLLVPLTLVPTLVFAEPSPQLSTHPTPSSRTHSPRPTASPEQSQGASGGAGAEICSRFSSDTGPVSGDLSSRFSQLQSNFGSRQNQVNQNFQKVTGQLQSDRSQDSSKLQADFAKLNALATTAAQKSAVTSFEATVETAIKTRNAAIDQADTIFRTGLSSDVSDRQAALLKAAQNYKASVQAAIQAAQASCTAGTAPATVYSTLKTALQTAQSALQTARQAADKLGPNVTSLESAHKQAVQAAVSTFQAAVKQALTSLLAVLHPVSSSPSPTASPGA